ncbi:MAG: 2-C-methyl-D-erythritol 4-phosphate cytidylyltransferase [Bifidobacterium crudilactis]|jgi:2-C-methyl-D-erythritol 4-phosphate cytidylyltransferase
MNADDANSAMGDDVEPRDLDGQETVPVVAVVLAAGFGTRFDAQQPKQLLEIDGKTLVAWSVEAFDTCPQVSDVVVVVNPQVREQVERALKDFVKVRMVIPGGAERADSTMEALQTLSSAGIPARAKILIHDAARPFVTGDAIISCIDALDAYDAATLAVQSTDTVLITRDSGDRRVIGSVPERENTFRAQTPQAFRFRTIVHAYELASSDEEFHPTDDTRAVVEYLPEVEVAVVAGSPDNMKITRKEDLPRAEHIAEERKRADARGVVHRMLEQALGEPSPGI